MSIFRLGVSAAALLVALEAAPVLAQGAPPTTVTSNNFNVRVGGFMILGAGYVDSDAHKAEVEIVNDSEVHFIFSLRSDNGLTFGAKAEIENNSGGSRNTTSDEYVGWVEGGFGRFEVGAEDGAQDRLAGGGKLAGGQTVTSVADGNGFLFDYASSESPFLQTDFNGGDTGDDLKVTYFTPRFAGFQAGVSYANAAEGPTSTDGARGDREAFELGANYRNTFGEVGVDVWAGYVGFSDPQQARFNGAQGDDTYNFGANLGFAGFTAGATYFNTSFKDNGVDDVEAYAVGLAYATGPWSFGAQYGEYIGGAPEDDMGVSLGAEYSLAPGVMVGLALEYADGKNLDRAADSEDAFAIGVLSGLTF
jgi:hypothetical protein